MCLRRAPLRSYVANRPTSCPHRTRTTFPATTIHRILYTPVYDPQYEKLADWLAGNGERPVIEGMTDEAMDRAHAFYQTHSSIPGALAAAGLSPSRLELEVTESVLLQDSEAILALLHELKAMGLRVALDDFGAGYTSFSYLKELPADLLKIDGSFIVNMNKHPANEAIVEAIVNLGRNLGMRTVAEWAEDHATVRTLVEIGVDYVQGFAIARPQSPERLLAASSSASFIEDEELARYTFTLGKTDDVLLQVDMFDHSRFRNIH